MKINDCSLYSYIARCQNRDITVLTVLMQILTVDKFSRCKLGWGGGGEKGSLSL